MMREQNSLGRLFKKSAKRSSGPSGSHVNISVVMSMANGQLLHNESSPVIPKSTKQATAATSMQDKFINDELLSNHSLLFQKKQRLRLLQVK